MPDVPTMVGAYLMAAGRWGSVRVMIVLGMRLVRRSEIMGVVSVRHSRYSALQKASHSGTRLSQFAISF